MEHLDPPHLVCALLTLERFLIEAHIRQGAAYRAGQYEPLPYLDALCKLRILLTSCVCTKTRRLELSDSEMPPLLLLINELPTHMQMQLEQAIEGERRGQCTHRAQQLSGEEMLRVVGSYSSGAAQQLLLQSEG